MTYCTLDTITRNRIYTDAELLEMLAGDSPNVADLLMNQFGEKVMRLVTRILKNEQDAEDAAMETFLTVLRKWHTFKGSCQLSSWICQIAKNQALMMIRQRRNVVNSLVSLDTVMQPSMDMNRTLADVIPEDSQGPYEELAQSELRNQIHQAIADLDPMYGDLYHMKEIQGLSLQQIASKLNMSEPAVKSRVHRARQELRCRLANIYYN